MGLCHRCGKPAAYEAIGGRLIWRWAALNWASRMRIRLRRRWRPWHLNCLAIAVEEYPETAPTWAQIRKRRQR